MLVFVLVCFLVCNHIDEEERAGCLAFTVFRMSFYCICIVALPHCAVCWSAVIIIHRWVSPGENLTVVLDQHMHSQPMHLTPLVDDQGLGRGVGEQSADNDDMLSARRLMDDQTDVRFQWVLFFATSVVL